MSGKTTLFIGVAVLVILLLTLGASAYNMMGSSDKKNKKNTNQYNPNSPQFKGCYPGFILNNFNRCVPRAQFNNSQFNNPQLNSGPKCFPGQYLNEKKQCVTNQCTCTNGVGSFGYKCPSSNTAHCESCDDLYHLSKDKKCEKNVCICNNGTAIDHDGCEEHDADWCKKCNNGYTLSWDGYCDPPCDCPNGNPFTNGSCGSLADKGHGDCESCPLGYELTDKEYCKNKCNCQNGEAFEGEECESDNTMCKSCNEGFYLNDRNKCIPSGENGNDPSWIDQHGWNCDHYSGCRDGGESCCSESRKNYWIKDTKYASIDKKFAFIKCRHTCSYVDTKLPSPPIIDDTHKLSTNNLFIDPIFVEMYNGTDIMTDNKYNEIRLNHPIMIEHFFNLWIDDTFYTILRGNNNERKTVIEGIAEYLKGQEAMSFVGDLVPDLKAYKCCKQGQCSKDVTKVVCDENNGTWTETDLNDGTVEMEEPEIIKVQTQIKKFLYKMIINHFKKLLDTTPYLRDIILLHFNDGTLAKMHRETNFEKIVDFLKNYTIGNEILKKIYKSNFTNTQIAQLHHSSIDKKLYFLTIYIILTEIKDSPKSPHDYLCCNGDDCINSTNDQQDAKTENECTSAGGTWNTEHFNYPCCDGDNCSYNLNTENNRRNAKTKKECDDANGKWYSIYKQGKYCPSGIQKYNRETESSFIQSLKEKWCAPWEPETVDNCNDAHCPNDEDKYCPPNAIGSSSNGFCCIMGEWVEGKCNELSVNIIETNKNPNLTLSRDQCTEYANKNKNPFTWKNDMNSENKPKGCFTIDNNKKIYYNNSQTSTIKCTSTNKCIELKTVPKKFEITVTPTPTPIIT